MTFKRGLFLSICLVSQSLFATDYYIDDIYNAEEIGRGNVEGFSTSSQGIWSNPASLQSIQNVSVAWYSATFMDDDVNYNNYTTSLKFKNFKVGLGYYDVRSGDLEVNTFDDFGEATTDAYYTFSNSILKLALQHPVSDWGSLGVAVSRYAYSGYTLTGEGYSADIGGLISLPLKRFKTLHLSATYKNIIPQKVSFSNGHTEEIPSSLVFSSKTDLSDSFGFLFQRTVHFNKAALSGIGLTYLPWHSTSGAFCISVGASNYLHLKDTSKTNTVYSAGLGLTLSKIALHFAYQNDPKAYSDKQFFYTTVINL